MAARTGFLLWAAGGPSITAEVDDNQLFGSNIRLEFVKEEEGQERIRGAVFDQPVTLTMAATKATGLYGTTPFNLYVEEPSKGVLHVRGLVGGNLARWEIEGNKWTGYVGRCGYELTGGNGVFTGTRACGMRRQGVRIEIGSKAAQWRAIERATVLTLLMGG